MKFVVTLLILLSLVSCSSYNQIVKSDDYEAKYNEANRLFADKKYERSITLYEQVFQRSPKSPQGEVSFYRLGKAAYNYGDWYLASYYLTAFQTKFPYSNFVEETIFLAALCAVENSPEASLDQNETEMALNELQGFITRFPNSNHVDTCNLIMDQLRFKLQTKEVLNVRLYDKTENFRAAAVSGASFLENYPISTYREEVAYLLVKNYYFLTVNSIDTKLEERIEKTTESYLDFLAEFPNSSYLRELEGYKTKVEALKTSGKTLK